MKKKQTLMAIFQGETVALNELLKANTLPSLFNFILAFERSNSYLKNSYEMEYHCMLATLKGLFDQLNKNI